MTTDRIVKRDDGIVEMPIALAAVLLDAVSFPPVKAGKYVSHAGVPWRLIEEAREKLDGLGYDWRGVHNSLHGRGEAS